MFAINAQIATTPIARARVALSFKSPSANSPKAIEHAMPVTPARHRCRAATTIGITVSAMGMMMRPSGAGSDADPSHHTGRPMVRLEMATAVVAAKVSSHVTMLAVRQPVGGGASNVGDVRDVGGAGSSDTSVTVSTDAHGWQAQPQ